MGIVVVWFLPAVVVAVVVGRGIRFADVHSGVEYVLTTADPSADLRPGPTSSPR